MMQLLQFFVIGLKFVIPSLMLWNPFLGLWGNYFLDVIDGDILLSLGMKDFAYQTIDKFADLASYVIMFILGSRWKIKRTVAILFFYRMIGQILFFLTRKEEIFFLFQNFLEPLMMIYALLVLVKRSEAKAYRTYRRHIVLIWTIILAYKIWNEWYLHVANVDLSLLFFGFTGGQ